MNESTEAAIRGVDKSARESKRHREYVLALVAIVLLATIYAGAHALGVPLPPEALSLSLTAVVTVAGIMLGSRSWHDRGVRVAAIMAGRDPAAKPAEVK